MKITLCRKCDANVLLVDMAKGVSVLVDRETKTIKTTSDCVIARAEGGFYERVIGVIGTEGHLPHYASCGER